jgi:hypothetical protein
MLTNQLDRASPDEKPDLRVKTASAKLTEAEYLN